MEIALGSLTARLERPQTRKFAWPIVVLPELFTAVRHLTLLAGYLVSIGWEVYMLDPHPQKGMNPPLTQSRGGAFRSAATALADSLSTIGSDVIAVGHGLGGLLALKMAEAANVRAAVALAPLVPGFRSPLFIRARHPLAFWRAEASGPPTGRRLYELVTDADVSLREAITKSLVAADTTAALEIARGDVQFGACLTPRMVLAGESDGFAPCDGAKEFARQIGAEFVSFPGRGHWLIGGRILERVIAELQRFLVRALGEELLLLYSESGGETEE